MLIFPHTLRNMHSYTFCQHTQGSPQMNTNYTYHSNHESRSVMSVILTYIHAQSRYFEAKSNFIKKFFSLVLPQRISLLKVRYNLCRCFTFVRVFALVKVAGVHKKAMSWPNSFWCTQCGHGELMLAWTGQCWNSGRCRYTVHYSLCPSLSFCNLISVASAVSTDNLSYW